jgi:hypothetical protein
MSKAYLLPHRSEAHPQTKPEKTLRKPIRDQMRPTVPGGRCPARAVWAPKKVIYMEREKPEVK